jgi:hypothetical protein
VLHLCGLILEAGHQLGVLVMLLVKDRKLIPEPDDLLTNPSLLVQACRNFLLRSADLLFDRSEFVFCLLGVNLGLSQSSVHLFVLDLIPHQSGKAAQQLFFRLGQNRSGQRRIHSKPMGVLRLNLSRLRRTDIEFTLRLRRLRFDALMRIWISRFHRFRTFN